MANGIASLRGYQEIPDVYANILAAIRSGASQQVLPDTLKGEQRAEWMRDLDYLGTDTTQVNQQGIYNLFRDELPELLELVSQLHPEESRNKDRLLAIEPYSGGTAGRANVGGTYYPDEHKINLNLLLPTAGSDVGGHFNIFQTQEDWESSPAENVRRILFHELGHAAGTFSRGWSPLSGFDLSTWKQRTGEIHPDNFAAILQAVRSASPEDSRRDVLDEAQRLNWADTSGYKYRTGEGGDRIARRQPGWVGPENYTGYGLRNDPLVVNPSYVRRVSRIQRNQMRPTLERILATPMYEGHSLNEPVAAEGLGGKWHRGIRSLRNLWDRVRS